MLPVAILVGVGALLIKKFTNLPNVSEQVLKVASSTDSVQSAENFASNANIFWTSLPAWFWFLSGAVVVGLIFYILNWMKV